LQATSFK